MQDLVRRRIFVILALFGLGMVVLSVPLRQLTIGQWYRLIADVGLGATDLSVSLIAILLGATLVAGDIDRRTAFPLLAKPLSRQGFVAGKFLGLVVVAGLLVLAMGGGTLLMLLGFTGRDLHVLPVVQATLGIFVHAILVGALAVMFSSFTSSTLAATFSLALLVIGHLTQNIAFFAYRLPSTLGRSTSLAIARALPDLELLNLKTLAAHGVTVGWSDLSTRFAYGLSYSVAVLAIGAVVFARRDLK